MLKELIKVANDLDQKGFFKEADFLDSIIEKVAAKNKQKSTKKTKSRSRPEPIFDAKHKKIKDNKDHFPINTEARARNALARVNQYSKAPSWYDGTLEELVNAVVMAVKKKYKNIEISEAAKKPKG